VLLAPEILGGLKKKHGEEREGEERILFFFLDYCLSGVSF
jgi:hypothetical protein